MSVTMMILTILVYLGAVIYIGYRCSKQNKSSDDFYLGGRKLGPFVTAMSAEASDMSSWLLMGLPGVALLTGYMGNTTGFAEAFWTVAGLFVGTYLNWLIVAKRIRRYTEKTKSVTLPDFFSNRFHDKAGMLCAVSAIVILIFFVPYTASGFSAVGKLFNSLFGVDYHMALIVGAFVIAAYTVLGGFLAASTTDFIQSIVMTIALFVVVCFGVEHAGGLDVVAQNVKQIPNYFKLTGLDGSYGFLPIVSTLAWGLGYFGMPHILLRFMAIEDDSKLKISRRVASIWMIISTAIAIGIGVIGFTYAKQNGVLFTEGFDAERIIIYMAQGIANLDSFGAIVAGIIISGILASTMSTADSQMLAAASSFSENLVKRFVFRRMGGKAQMWLARGTVLAITVVAIFLAWNPDSSVFRIVSFAWAGFGAAFGALILFALFWKRTTKWGALAGMISGASMVFIWKYGIARLGGVFANLGGVYAKISGVFTIYELLPAFLVSAFFIVFISLVTPKPEKSVIAEFEEVAASMKRKKNKAVTKKSK